MTVIDLARSPSDGHTPISKKGQIVTRESPLLIKLSEAVTHVRTMEREKEELLARLRTVGETVDDPTWEVDDRWIYTSVSRRAGAMLGRKPEDVIGKPFCDFMPLKEANRMSRMLASFAAAGKSFSLVQGSHLHQDGHTVCLETSGIPFFDEDGNLRGYRGVHRDVTQSREVSAEVEQVLKKLEGTVDGTVRAMTLMAEVQDQNIAGHQRRVADLSCTMASFLNLPYERREMLRVAASLHDLGKTFIPAEILNKPDKLTEAELAIVRTHPRAGYDVLTKAEFPWAIADIVLQHHERMNGSGYPAGLKGEEILFEARIMAVADVVEAMCSKRSYRPAQQLDFALRELARDKGQLYDVDAAEACLTAFLDHGFRFA